MMKVKSLFGNKVHSEDEESALWHGYHLWFTLCGCPSNGWPTTDEEITCGNCLKPAPSDKEVCPDCNKPFEDVCPDCENGRADVRKEGNKSA